MTFISLSRLTCLTVILFLATTLVGEAAPQNIAELPISRIRESWWRQRFDEKQAELSRGPVDLLWLGDSITQDWEHDGPEPWLKFAPVWNRFYGDRHAVNLGFKGDSTCHLLWRLRHGELDSVVPRGVILLIGANNFGRLHTDAAQTEAGIDVIMDEIHQKLPRTPILLLGVLPSIRSQWVTQNTNRLNADLRRSVETARPYVTYRDVGSILMQDGEVNASAFIDPHLVPPAPPLHPTAQIQAEIAAAIEPIVAHMLGDHIHS